MTVHTSVWLLCSSCVYQAWDAFGCTVAANNKFNPAPRVCCPDGATAGMLISFCIISHEWLLPAVLVNMRLIAVVLRIPVRLHIT